MVLVINYWSNTHSHVSYDPTKEQADIETISKYLELQEKRCVLGLVTCWVAFTQLPF